MEAMAQEWTEGRLDELSSNVDRGFERFDRRFTQVESEIGSLRLETRSEFTAMRGEMKEGFERVNDRIDSVQRTIVFGAVTLTGAILAGFAAMCTLLAAAL